MKAMIRTSTYIVSTAIAHYKYMTTIFFICFPIFLSSSGLDLIMIIALDFVSYLQNLE